MSAIRLTIAGLLFLLAADGSIEQRSQGAKPALALLNRFDGPATGCRGGPACPPRGRHTGRYRDRLYVRRLTELSGPAICGAARERSARRVDVSRERARRGRSVAERDALGGLHADRDGPERRL